MLIEIKSAEQFDKEIQSGKVLVDFNATWCGPCQMLKPIIEKIGAREDIKVLSVDTDEVGEVAARYDVYSIPTLLLLEDGKLMNKSVGFIPEPAVLKFAGLQ